MDRRQQKTRKAIFEAFEKLLEEKSYEKITVKDIIDEANVGRSTFYAHFETKDDLLTELCAHLFDHVFRDRKDTETVHDFDISEGSVHTIIAHILYHLKENGRTIGRLLAGESGETFTRYFRAYLDHTVIIYIIDGLTPGNFRVPDEFLRNHISGSFVNMIRWWIGRDMKDRPEDLADYFLAVIEPVCK